MQPNNRKVNTGENNSVPLYSSNTKALKINVTNVSADNRPSATAKGTPSVP